MLLRHLRRLRGSRQPFLDTYTERWNIDFVVAKSIRYHAYRRSFWNGLDVLSKMVTAISGTAVLVTLVGDNTVWSTGLAILVAVASATDLVLGFSKKARLHDDIYRSFSRLAQEIAENLLPTEQLVVSWRRRRLEIEMDEPTTLDLLERRCCADEARARGSQVRPEWKLNRVERYLAQIALWPSRT